MTMKMHFRFLFRSLLLAAAVLPLANCASSGSGGAYAPSPVSNPYGSGGTRAETSPASTSDYTIIRPDGTDVGSTAVSRGLRFSSDALSRRCIDSLIQDEKPATLAKQKSSRQGLATQAGHEMTSAVADIPFYRKTTGQADAVDSFHYNDETGARAMAEVLGGGSKKRGSFSVAGGRLEVALQSGGYSGPFERYEAGGKRIVIGSPGSSYEIFLSNRTKHAVEVVASVDSLDVMDGKSASVKKRGYIIPAKSDLAIEGFRVNARTVKRFVFGSVDASAAAKAGQARNVGVIGLAVYDEDEAQAKIARLVETQKRSVANPF